MTIKIAIISDTHFGFARGTERENDCWDAAEEAFDKAKDCDLIILPGDIFDGRIPKPEDWAKSIKILSKIKKPIIAIHGTHERRGRGLINPIEGLAYAGFLKHIHCSHEIFEIKNKKIAVYGMSGVPESYAKEVLDNWSPKPEKDAYNIFMLHQSIAPYIYNPKNPPSLRLDDLPKGFDLYISGHIHWPEKSTVHGKPFLIPGSTITTQIKKKEAEKPKGFYMIELNGKEKIEFVELENQRKIFYREFEINHDKITDIEQKIENFLSEINEKKKPIVRVVIKGNKKAEQNFDFTRIKEKYRKKMILSITNRVVDDETTKKIKLMKDIKNKRLSIEEMGIRILKENLKEMNAKINYDDIFETLVNGNIDVVIAELLSRIDNVKYSSKEEIKTPDKSGLNRWIK